MALFQVPDRGRIVIVDFELGGGAIDDEMRKPRRPCIVVRRNRIDLDDVAAMLDLKARMLDRRDGNVAACGRHHARFPPRRRLRQRKRYGRDERGRRFVG